MTLTLVMKRSHLISLDLATGKSVQFIVDSQSGTLMLSMSEQEWLVKSLKSAEEFDSHLRDIASIMAMNSEQIRLAAKRSQEQSRESS